MAFFTILTLVGVGLLILRSVVVSCFWPSHEAKIWRRIETVGVPVSKIFPWTRALAKSIVSTRQLAHEGYKRFSVDASIPFALPTTWNGKALVIMPPSELHSWMTRPDKQADSEITNIMGLIESIQLPYIIKDPDIYMNALHFDVVRRKMSKKDMGSFAKMTGEECEASFRDIWGTSKEWKTIKGWDACGAIIARVGERMMLGLPWGRDEELLKASRLYANAALLNSALINCFPPWVRTVMGPLLSLQTKYHQRNASRLLTPLIQERMEIHKSARSGDSVPDDFLQWLIQTCEKDGPHQMFADRIANRLIALMTPLIFATCYAFASTVFDLYGSPNKDDYLQGLEAEIKQVKAAHGGLDTAEACNALHRADSTIRESMRVSDVFVVNLYRDVVAGQVDIGNGLTMSKGLRMAFPTQDIHLDEKTFGPDSRTFDAFRFSRKFEGMSKEEATERAQERETLINPTKDWVPLGYGRHACPGRFFVAQNMKQALSFIVMNYDVELLGKPIKRKALLNVMVPPVELEMRIRWKGGD